MSLINVQEEQIPILIENTNNTYRNFDPGKYLYKLVMNFSSDNKFSDEFIELVYTTLIAWDMDHRNAKLSEFAIFRQSLLDNQDIIRNEKYRIETSEPYLNEIQDQIRILFVNLNLVALNKPKLVTFSKTLHFFLPNLLMPIDRNYTLKFYYNSTYIPNNSGNADQLQLKKYFEVFDDYRQFAMNHELSIYLNDNWNRNIPKIIDNLIIALKD